MSSNTDRRWRHIFDGTGVYIALFLIVTALAVAGYWTLIPHTPSPADEAVVETVPAPAVVTPPTTSSASVNRTRPDTVPVMPELAPEEATPVQNAVTITIPEETETVDLTPVAPALIVSPLVGETVAAFSIDELQYSETMGDWRTHDGVDIAAEPGTPVCAACAGTVLDVREDDLMGTTVVISHDGGYDTIYANLQSEPTVSIGDFVTAGQVIGSVGRTALGESALASHLHFGVTKDGEYVDPLEYLKI